ncbi:hypothetical protein OTU49_000866, partial [Cherax quadricarinatus]
MVSVVVWGVVVWLFQQAWHWLTGGQSVKLSTALLFSWGTILNQPPINQSISDSGKVLVGMWLVFCLVITTGYSSSLIAHLTIQGKTTPPETFEDLVARKNWRWGLESWLIKGSPGQYFALHTDPVVRQIYKKMEIVTAEEAMPLVKQGSYTLFSPKFHITVVIDSFYTDKYGQTPYYITNEGIHVLAEFG